ncbi:Mitochondrial thiamine pyrophosphate carrier [Strongyloides ratti]|uniref:Mitochondrial thiamine pyrophosphate carrier n=1 Tax=Strongyloides ratti TaxID=34506 RepID=A0A090LRI6_STRRB|nr:Mitochondrial thiamine pyrophosphate carrier [Strongyloides ratti]CEF70772.1 Mitochondrial thiamine pyrophosphate carrier [Strongyloides ratti]
MTLYESITSGFLTGTTTRLFVQPLDVLKIRYQLQEESTFKKGGGKYNGIIQSIKTIYKEEGITAFWKGHTPAQLLSQVYAVVQFSTYIQFAKYFSKIFNNNKDNQTISDFFAGSLSGCLSITVSMPLDVIRTKMVAQGTPKIYKNIFHATKKISKKEGYRGFYKGLSASLTQTAPYTGLQFLSYNYLGNLWDNATSTNSSSIGSVICGGLAGCFSKFLVYPFDVVRHRMQVLPSDRRGFGKTTEYIGMIGTFRKIIHEESVIGLYKGLVASVLKASAMAGLSFCTFEIFAEYLRKK